MPKYICLVGMMVCLMCALLFWFNTADSYKGKELLTPAQYEDFKVALVNKDVSISYVTILSSTPVFVDFKVSVPQNQPFPFGELSNKNDRLISTVITGVFFLACLGLFSWGWYLEKA